jgi:hypothetical protein
MYDYGLSIVSGSVERDVLLQQLHLLSLLMLAEVRATLESRNMCAF